MQYKIIKNMDFYHFQDVVNGYLSDGWKPHGNLQVILSAGSGGIFHYIQALIKE